MRTYLLIFIFTLAVGFGAGAVYRNPRVLGVFTDVRVSDMSYKALSDSSVSISFKTNRPASTLIKYGTTELYGVESSQSGVLKDHYFVLPGLLPGKDHNFMVVMKDEKGKTYTSGNYLIKSK